MAWIELDLSVLESPEVLQIADAMDWEPYQAIGPLALIWGYVDEHGRLSGNDALVEKLTISMLQRAVPLSVAPVVALLVDVQWLYESEDGLVFPNYKRHAPKGCRRDRKEWGKRTRNKGLKKDESTSSATTSATSSGTDSGTRSGTDSGTPTDRPTKEVSMSEDIDTGTSNKGDPEFVSFTTVIGYWNTVMGQVCRATAKRKRQFAARVRDPVWRGEWRLAIDRASQSSFLRGDSGGWRADFEWFLRPDSVTAILEGKYDDRDRKRTESGSTQSRRHESNMAALSSFLHGDDGDFGDEQAAHRAVEAAPRSLVLHAADVPNQDSPARRA